MNSYLAVLLICVAVFVVGFVGGIFVYRNNPFIKEAADKVDDVKDIIKK